jgi:hypothetical protein
MASRVSLIQSRSIYVGTLNSVAPSDGNLIVSGNVLIGTTTDIGTKLNVNGTSYISGAASFGSTIDVNGNVTLTQDTNDLIFQQTNSSTHGIVWKNTTYAKDSASIRPTGNGAWATQGIGFYTGSFGNSTSAPLLRFNIQAGGDSIFYNNVGIGTTAPTVPLQIVNTNSTISMTNSTAFAVDTGSRIFLGGKYSSATSNNTSAFAWLIGAKENATDGNQAGYLSFTTTENGGGFAERMRITSTGNVGIGTTAPTEKLHVVGNAKVEGSIGVTNIVTNYVVKFNGSILDDSIIYDNGTNVGIGTTSPGSKLQVVGSPTQNVGLLNVTNTVNGLGVVYPAALFNNQYGNHSYGIVSIFKTGSLAGTDRPSILFYSDLSAASWQVGQVTSSSGWGTNDSFGIGYRANNLPGTFNTWPTNYFTITTAGNVGIGTTSPTNKLHVNGGSIFNQDGFLYMSNQFPIVWGAAVSIEGDNAAGTLTLKTESSHRIFINNVGNVGVGTTSPTNRLTVTTATNAVDVLRLNNTGGDSGSVQGVTHLAINHFNSGTNPSTRITAYQDSTSGWPGGMYFSTRSLNTDSAPVERMRITSGGNVGIGTTSPQYMLDVNGDAQINAPGTGPAYAHVPDGGFGLDSLITSGSENVALGKPDVWLRIHVDGVAFVFPGYQEP